LTLDAVRARLATNETRRLEMGSSEIAYPASSTAPVQVVGVCGQTVDLVVQGVVVRFTCLATAWSQVPPQPPGPLPPKDIFKPGDPEPPHVATIIELEGLEPDLLVRLSELDPEADPFVIPVKTGDAIAMQDLHGDFFAAREQGRAVRLEIE
jgi:hypothetical protein